MKRNLWLGTGFIILALGLSGCAEVMQQINEMATLTKCQFRLASVQDTSLVGIRIQGGKMSDLGASQLFKMQRAFSTGTLPLEFTVNIEVKNPNTSTAGMSRVEWIAYMDGTELTSGLLERSVSIPANGGVGTLPLVVSLDLKKTLTGKSLDSLVNLALNIAGEGDHPTKVTLRLKPSIRVGRQTLLYPDYVTVNHEFGKVK